MQEQRNPLELAPDRRKQAIAAIQAIFREQREEEVGDLGASLLLDELLEALGPSIYNQALADAQRWFTSRLEELEVDYAQLVKREPVR